jgi:hypothetical protein
MKQQEGRSEEDTIGLSGEERDDTIEEQTE